ncbi:MAG TPA: alpha/beta hydrolase [Stellaceae bacterium]|nr:alpha/beta hydrolase [Stellaceae bacterium]
MPELVLTGPAGRLEARYHPSRIENAPLALILHPHPQHGGTMHNKVVYTLFHAFARQGFVALRFNFRGVGKSQGSYGSGEGELADAAAALDWLQNNNPDAEQCWIAGFSFGAWIALQLLARRPESDAFVAVAPPVNLVDFNFLTRPPSAGLIVQGDKDQIVAPDSVKDLAQRLQKQRSLKVEYRLVAGADHFFTDRLDTLSETVEGYIAARLRTARATAKV